MQRRRGAQDDEERDQVGEAHPEVSVPADPAQVVAGDRLRMRQEVCAAVARGDGLEILHFLRRLPEKQVRADGRTEDGNDHRDRVVVQLELRKQRALEDLRPGTSRVKTTAT